MTKINNIAFIIASKDGGEDYGQLFCDIREGVDYLKTKGIDISYRINLLINGSPDKPNFYLNHISNKTDLNIVLSKTMGKVSVINEFLPRVESNWILVLDDDISFGKELLYLAIRELEENDNLALVSFQTRAQPYKGKNILEHLFYDIINVRSLAKLYKGVDPFLLGRFLFMKKEYFTVPDDIINEDLYLGITHEGKYIIRPEEIAYRGESSLLKHIKRVLRLEAGRSQVKSVFGERYRKYLDRNSRDIDYDRLGTLSIYWRFCFSAYKFLRFVTNSVIGKIFKHKTNYY